MPAHARAPPAGGAGAGPGSGLGSGSGSLPGLVLFESGLTGMGCEHTRSATRARPAPLRIQTAPVGQPTIATVGSNRCNGSDRTVTTFRWVRTRWPLQFLILNTPTQQTRKFSLSLSSELKVIYCVMNWKVEF